MLLMLYYWDEKQVGQCEGGEYKKSHNNMMEEHNHECIGEGGDRGGKGRAWRRTRRRGVMMMMTKRLATSVVTAAVAVTTNYM